MQAIIVFAAVLVACAANPLGQGVSLTQDTAGNYNLKYETEDASRSEQGFQDGKVVGSFTYKDTDGAVHTIKYVAAGDAGFTAEGDIPRPVQETPEVAAVRAAHLAVVAKERAILPPLREEETHFVAAPVHFAAPVQFAPIEHVHFVDNTAELEAAKAEHFAAHQAALARLDEEYRKVAV